MDIKTEVIAATRENDITKVISIIDNENTYGIKSNNVLNTSIALKIKIPKILFQSILASTSNGKIYCSQFSCSNLICASSEGKLLLSNIKCNDFKGNTTNSKIELSSNNFDNVFVKTSKSPVIINGSQFKSLEVNSLNSRIFCELTKDVMESCELKLVTTNEDIDIEFPSLLKIPLYIDAFSQNGSVTIDLPNFSYSENTQDKSDNCHIIGQTQDYGKVSSNVKIVAHTTNYSINIK